MRNSSRFLGAYLPEDRRRALAHGRPLPERQDGAALFADLSGFTGLTERLAARLGPLHGAEELGGALRRVFTPLIARVEEEGGSVLGFAGDAITCWFEGDDGARAVRAAVRMQHEVAQLTDRPLADREPMGVRLKVAVAVGPSRRFGVGDPDDRLWDVMAGATLARLAALEKYAQPGEVVADGQAARASGIDFPFERGDAHVLRPLAAPGDPDDAVDGDADAPVLVARDGDERATGAADAADAAAAPEANHAPAGAARAGRDGQGGAAAAENGKGPGEGADEPEADTDVGPLPVRRVVPLPLSPPLLPQDDPWPDGDVAATWAPAVARQRLEAGAEPLGDFRPAGAMFLRFSGIDWDADPDAGPRLDAFVRRVQRELATWGGTLVQFTVGDKGSYLYAAFGAPRAHGDDAERAVACAMRLVSLSGPEVGSVTGLRAGVSYGAMFTGSYGSEVRGTYGVLGPKTNLAARLMQRAGDGEVLCDPEVARRARRTVRFAALPPERFKGIANPIPVYRPEGRIEASPDEVGPLFGREEERRELAALLAELGRGTGGAVRYEGDAGVGKSRLLAWVAEAAREHAIPVVAAAPDRDLDGVPFVAWRRPLRALLSMRQDAPVAGIAPAVERLGVEAPGDVAIAREAIGGFDPTAAPAWANPLAGRSERDAAVAALAEVVRRSVKDAPRVLLLDDAHELDALSLDLLDRVARLAKEIPLLVVVAGRPGSADDAHRRAFALPARTLSGLEPEASTMVIAHALGVPAKAVPYPVATSLHERAGGLPLLLEELVRDLVERDALSATTGWEGVGRAGRGGTLKRGGVRVSFDEAALRDLKTGLDGLLLARLDRLTVAERSALKAASVVGMTARHEPLAHLLERDPVALESSLSPLEGPDMLEALDDAHRFRKSGVHGAAYQTLLFEQRRRMHRQMGDWYLDHFEAGEEVDADRMVEHVFHATHGERDPALVTRAVDALQRLAEDRVRGEVLAKGIETLDRVIELLPDEPAWLERRTVLTLRCSVLHARRANLTSARELADAAIRLADQRHDPAIAAEAQAALAGALALQGAKRELRKATAAALELARPIGGRAWAAALAAEAKRAARDGELAAAVEALTEAETVRAEADELPERVEAHATMAWLALRMGATERAASHAERAGVLAQEAGVRRLLGLAERAVGSVAAAMGEEREARNRLGRAQEAFESSGERYDAAATATVLAELDLAAGRFEDADTRAAAVLEYALGWGATPLAIRAAAVRARVSWHRGHARWAVRLLTAADAHPEIDPETRWHVAEALQVARAELAPHAYRTAMEKGAATRIEDARHGPPAPDAEPGAAPDGSAALEAPPDRPAGPRGRGRRGNHSAP